MPFCSLSGRAPEPMYWPSWLESGESAVSDLFHPALPSYRGAKSRYADVNAHPQNASLCNQIIGISPFLAISRSSARRRLLRRLRCFRRCRLLTLMLQSLRLHPIVSSAHTLHQVYAVLNPYTTSASSHAVSPLPALSLLALHVPPALSFPVLVTLYFAGKMILLSSGRSYRIGA